MLVMYCLDCNKLFDKDRAFRAHMSSSKHNANYDLSARNKRKLEYKNDKFCSFCNLPLEYYKRNNKFCSSSCSAKYNNTKRDKSIIEKQRKTIIQKLYNSSLDEFDFKKRDYYNQCQFKFDFFKEKNIIGYDLLYSIGLYNTKTNPCGVVRDHMFSISQGYKQNIDPNIISHPANCEIILFKDNSIKNSKCSISLEELLIRINKWPG